MSKKKAICTCDCETDPFIYGRIPAPFVWGFYGFGKFHHFHSTEGFVDFIENCDPCYCFAHNGGKFDYHFMLDFIPSGQEIKIINGRLSEFRIGNVTFRDSFNILPVPLAALQKDVFDYTKLEADVRHKHMPEIIEYLKNDCVYLHDAVSEFIGKYDNKLTLAGAAMNQWKKFHKEIPRTHGDYYERFSPYYYGGRVEPFKTGIFDGDFKVYDINSAYPTMMKSKFHPYGSKYKETTRPFDSELPAAMLTIECDSFGALPLRGKNGLSFPHARNEFKCTGHEFIAGLETGTIKNPSIKHAYVFFDLIQFDEYVDHFYELKKVAGAAGDNAGYLHAKLFLNSLYGKWATNPDNYSAYILGRHGDSLPAGYSYGNVIGDTQIFCRDLEDNEKFFYNLATSASITGAVRAYLWESICSVDEPLYCDTDSIICSDGDSLSLGSDLGQWDIEGECDRVAIAGKKLYSCRLKNGQYKTASKGVKLTPKEIERVAKGEKVMYRSDAPTFSLKSGVGFTVRNVIATA